MDDLIVESSRCNGGNRLQFIESCDAIAVRTSRTPTDPICVSVTSRVVSVDGRQSIGISIGECDWRCSIVS